MASVLARVGGAGSLYITGCKKFQLKKLDRTVKWKMSQTATLSDSC